MLICILAFGLRMFVRYREARSGWTWAPYFLCLVPLTFSVAVLNHMNEDILLSSELIILLAAGFGISFLCLVIAGIGLTRIPEKGEHQILKGVALCTILISLFSGIVMAQTYYTYSQPKQQKLYFKPG